MSLAPDSLNTRTWKMRLPNESPIAVINVARCYAITGRTRRHQGSFWSREILARGPGYFEITPPRGFDSLSRSPLVRSEREEDTKQFYRLTCNTLSGGRALERTTQGSMMLASLRF